MRSSRLDIENIEMKASKIKVITEIKNYITEPKTGMLVSLINPRMAFSSVIDESFGNPLERYSINPGDIVLFLGNTQAARDSRFSHDQVLHKEKVVYILNDYPRTEPWKVIG